MRRILLMVFIFSILLLITPSSSSAVTRYSTCDVCGLCPTVNVKSGTCTVEATQLPGDWGSCAKCLYGITPPPAGTLPNCNTLRINGDGTLFKPVKLGRQFTLLGCITSGTSLGFENKDGQTGGAPTFVQKILDIIFALSGGLAFLYLMYGGFIILTSQADAEKLNYGRRLVTGAIAGLIITLGSVLLVNLIGSGILHIPGF